MLMPADTRTVANRTRPLLTRTGVAASTYDWTTTNPHVRVAEEAGSTEITARDRLRRLTNIVVASVLMVVTLPITILIGILIKLTSPGPILYTQARVGIDRRRPEDIPTDGRRVIDYGGRLFRIYKFRTMYVSPSDAPQRWARQDDPRVTPVGRFLRKYRLDELPQVYNVIRGDMNIVGPRPEQPRIFALLRDQIPHYELRQRVLPGITGLAQVHQKYDTSTEDVKRKVEYDLEYIARRSAGEDLRILFKTLPAVLKKQGW